MIGVLLLGALLVPSAAFARGGQEGKKPQADSGFHETGFPIVDRKITLKLFGPKGAIQVQWKDMLFFKTMEERTNIAFEFDTPAAGQAFKERKNILFASKDMPDVFCGCNFSESELSMFGSQGALMPLNDLIEKQTPNFRKRMEENPAIRKAIVSGEGKIYSLPILNEVFFDLTERAWIRREWIQKLGLKMPQTVDELTAVLAAFRDRDPNGNGKADEIPLTSTNVRRMEPTMFPAFGILWLQNYPFFSAEAGNKLSYIATLDNYKAFLQYMNRLYRDKLLDNNLFTNTDQELAAIGKEQRLGAYPQSAAFLYNTYENNELYEGFPVLTSSVNARKMWPRHGGVNNGQWSLSSKNPAPRESMRWVDYLFTPEGSMLVDQGIENVSWEWKDATKTLWQKKLPAGITNSEEFRATVTPASGGGAPAYVRLNEWLGKLDVPHSRVLVKEVGEKYRPVWQFVVPRMVLPEAEQKRATVIHADLDPYVEQMEAKFVVGEVSFDKWGEFQGVLGKMGVGELTLLYQKAFDRYNR